MSQQTLVPPGFCSDADRITYLITLFHRVSAVRCSLPASMLIDCCSAAHRMVVTKLGLQVRQHGAYRIGKLTGRHEHQPEPPDGRQGQHGSAQ